MDRLMETISAISQIIVALLPLVAIFIVAVFGPDVIDRAFDLVEMLKAKRRDGEW